MPRLSVFIVVAIVASWPITEVSAVQDYDSTPQEKEMCQQRVYSRKLANNPDWTHMHHYCDGLRFYDRAVNTREDASDFQHNIQNSIDNYDYVLKHTSPSFNMRPEVMVMRGRTLELGGRGPAAAEMYVNALKINPNFAMAYGALGNFYKRAGDRGQALKVYTEGLRRSPKNRYLRSRYEAMGGSLDSLEASGNKDADLKAEQQAPTTPSVDDNDGT